MKQTSHKDLLVQNMKETLALYLDKTKRLFKDNVHVAIVVRNIEHENGDVIIGDATKEDIIKALEVMR